REPADGVVLHGQVYTVDPKQPWAQAAAFRDGKIIAFGSDQEIETYRGASTKVIDAAGRMVLPGFVDTHIHLVLEPFRPGFVEFYADTIAEVLKRVKDHALANPDEPFVLALAMLTNEAAQ